MHICMKLIQPNSARLSLAHMPPVMIHHTWLIIRFAADVTANNNERSCVNNWRPTNRATRITCIKRISRPQDARAFYYTYACTLSALLRPLRHCEMEITRVINKWIESWANFKSVCSPRYLFNDAVSDHYASVWDLISQNAKSFIWPALSTMQLMLNSSDDLVSG